MVQPQPVTLFSEEPTIVAVMTKEEAQASEQRILSLTSDLRAELLRFYEGRGWAALGYASWRAWASARLGDTERKAYYELTAGQVEQILNHGSNGVSSIPERHLRPLAPLRSDPPVLRETWQRANDLAEERGERRTARHVEEAVKERAVPQPAPVEDEPLTPYEEQVAALQERYTPAPIEEQHPATTTPEPSPTPPAPTPKMAVHFSSASPEWYTPAHIVERVLLVFGEIDLDPCSNSADPDEANVPARVHYDREVDGLAQSWRVPNEEEESEAVRVYMNPPYGDEISAWTTRLLRAYDDGEITEAIALLPARTDTGWIQPLLRRPDVKLCFVTGRLRFVGGESTAPFPSVVAYLGRDHTIFSDAFEDIGPIR